jgi:transcriptional regulator with XRE-family HTH domain
MDRQNLSNIERGKKNIQALTVYRLAKELEVEVWELMKF